MNVLISVFIVFILSEKEAEIWLKELKKPNHQATRS